MAPGRTASWLQRLVLAAPVLWMLGAGWRNRWMTEDGYIYLRIVRQIEAGNGPVFNAGERVEAYTGTLWLGVLALGDVLLPVRLEWLAVGGGLLLTAAGVALAIAGSVRLWGDVRASHWLAPAGILVFVAITPVWGFATSGLENGLAFAWIGACAYLLGRWASSTATLGGRAAAVLGLGWLVRPELILLSASMFVAVVVADRHRQGWRRHLVLAAAAAALPIAYQLFRMGYFGSVVPNTGIAKEGSELTLARGWRYLRDLADPYLLLVPLLALVVGAHLPLLRDAVGGADRRRVAAIVALAGGAAVVAGYVVAMGGDYHHGRLLLAPLLAFVSPVAVVPVARRHLAVAVVGVWAVVAAAALRPEQYGADPLANGFTAADYVATSVTADEATRPGLESLERSLAEHGSAHERGIGVYGPIPFPLAPDVPVPLAVLRGVGITGYTIGTEVHVIDLMGLADTLTAHLRRRHPGDELLPAAGHEKPLPSPWLVARLTSPDTVIESNPLPPWGGSLVPDVEGDAYVEQVAWARAALRCPAIAELLAASQDELTLRRVLDNIMGSVANARLRIPPDPEEAYHRFCGEGTPPEVAALGGREQPSG